MIKSPKLFFIDTGLLCYLLRVETATQLLASPFGGHIFENMVVMEAVKGFAGRGERGPCYFYRTSSGQEVDLLIDYGDYLDAYEIKFSASPSNEMTHSLLQCKEEYPIKHGSLLTLHRRKHPFSNGIASHHWSEILQLLHQKS